MTVMMSKYSIEYLEIEEDSKTFKIIKFINN